MANVAIGWQNAAKNAAAVFSAGTQALPPSNLAIDQGSPSLAYQSAAGDVTPFIKLDSGSTTTAWQALCLFRTNLTAAATVNWYYGTDTSYSLAGGVGVQSAGVVAGYGQSIVIPAIPVTCRYLGVNISDPANPDGFISIGLMYAGPVFTPQTNIAWSSASGRKDLTVEAVTRGGQEYPRPQWQQRKYKMDLQGVRSTEVWSVIDQLDGSARQGGNILCVPVPGAATMGQEAVFGRLTDTTDITRPFGNGNRLAYTGTFIERL